MNSNNQNYIILLTNNNNSHEIELIEVKLNNSIDKISDLVNEHLLIHKKEIYILGI